MKRIIFTGISALLLFSGCTAFDRTPEERAKIQEKRRKQQKIRSNAKYTTLPGLNATEMQALKASESETLDNGASFVFSGKPPRKEPPKSLKVLNEQDKENLKTFHESEKEQSDATKNWVYGL